KYTVHSKKHDDVLGGHRRCAHEFRPRAFGETFVAGGQDRRATWSRQEIRKCSRHRTPRSKSSIRDEYESPSSVVSSPHCACRGSRLLRRLHVVNHCVSSCRGRLLKAYVGSPPVSLRINRMHVCRK